MPLQYQINLVIGVLVAMDADAFSSAGDAVDEGAKAWE
jgi:hypothetical protein